jgi:hypothetical protein
VEPRIKGHRLHPGPLAYAERGKSVYVAGAAVCQCGSYSPTLPSNAARMEWHRRHLADVIEGRTRLL